MRSIPTYTDYVFDQEAGVALAPLDEDILERYAPMAQANGVLVSLQVHKDYDEWRYFDLGITGLRRTY